MPFPGISGIWPQQNPFTTLRARTFNAQAAFGGMTVINVFRGLTAGTSQTALRVTNNGTTAITLNQTYIGYRVLTGQPYDFDDTPTQVTWNSGNASVTIASGATVTSDTMNFAIQPTTVIATNLAGTTPTSAYARYLGGLPQSQNLTYTSYSSIGVRIRTTTRETSGAIVFNVTQVSKSTAANHNLLVGDPFYFANGTIAGLTAGTIYYVQSVPSLTSFRLTTTPGGSAFTAASAPVPSGTVYLCPQTAGVQNKGAGYPALAVGTLQNNNGVQSIFSAILVRNP